MSSPEMHFHVHFHNDARQSALTEGDILTEHTYTKPKPPANPDQLGFDSVSETATEESGSGTTETPEQPVAITPQTVHDQRTEIADYSERNKHLAEVDKQLSDANKLESGAERVKLGFLSGYSESGLKQNAKKARLKASEELTQACGHCALDCAIRNNFTKWSRVHESATIPKTADQESRQAWRRRLVKDANAHCLPGKSKRRATKNAG